MPFITITASPGLSSQQKRALLQASSDAACEALEAPVQSVRIVLHELSADDYICAGLFDVPMILFDIDMIEGRSEQMRADLIKALSVATHTVIGISEEDVRVRLRESPSANMGVANGLTAKQRGR